MSHRFAKYILVVVIVSAMFAMFPEPLHANCWPECILYNLVGDCIKETKVCDSEHPIEDIERETQNLADALFEQGDNCAEKKSKKEQGWTVVFGPQFNEGHYADLVAAIYTAIEEQDTTPLEEFFGDSIDRIYDKMGDELQEIGEQALFDLVIGAVVGNSGPIQQGRMEIEAGLMECQRWVDISLGGYTKRVSLIPVNYPYVRYRTNSAIRFPMENLHEAYKTAEAELNQIEIQLQLLQQQGVSSPEIENYLEAAVEDAIANAILALASKYLPQVDADDSRALIKSIVRSELHTRSITAQSDRYLVKVRTVLNNLIRTASEKASDYIIDTIRERPATLILDWADTNERAVKRSVEESGWHVVWGKKINDAEYVKLVAAIIAAPETGGASIAAYFNSYLARTMVKLEKQAPEISEEVIEELLSDLADEIGSGGRGFTERDFGNLKIEAGVATYKRGITFDYPEIAYYPCVWEVPFGDLGTLKTEGACTKQLGMADARIPLPNHHQPYVRFRWKDGRSAKPTGPDQATTQPIYYPNPNAFSPAHSPARGSVVADRVNVRSGPGKNYPVIGSLSRSRTVDITGQNNGWWQIQFRYQGGEFGWISGSTVTTENATGVLFVAAPAPSQSSTAANSPDQHPSTGNPPASQPARPSSVSIVFKHSGKCARTTDGDLRNLPTQIEQASCNPKYRFSFERVPGVSAYYYIKVALDRGVIGCLGVPDVVRRSFGNGAVKVKNCESTNEFMWRLTPMGGANSGWNLLKTKVDEAFCLGIENYDYYYGQPAARLEDKRIITVNWCEANDPWQMVRLRP